MVGGSILSADLLQDQVDLINLLLAMYSGEGELSMRQQDSEAHQKLEELLERGERIDPLQRTSIHLTINVPITYFEENYVIPLVVEVALTHGPDVKDFSLAPEPGLSIDRPSWLTRRACDLLLVALSNLKDGITEAIELLKSEVPRILAMQRTERVDGPNDLSDKPIVRVWFYFPSLSTREKRNDLVNLAPAYRLTGFVLAGKPGVLCLEGSSEDIQAYIADIKRNSWGDIPSFQKKISERFREDVGIINRKFETMREITDDITRHGQRGNRGDLAQVEQFLVNVGLGDAFGKVFMQREG